MKRIILGVCLMLLLTAGLFRPQFVPVPVSAAGTTAAGTSAATLPTEDDSAATAPAETIESSPEFVDETFDLTVIVSDATEAISGRVVLTAWLEGTTVELWKIDLVSKEKKLVAQAVTNDVQMVTFRNVVRPIDPRWFDQKTRQKLDKPLEEEEVKEFHVYQVFAKQHKNSYASLPTTLELIPSFYPKTREEIDTTFQPNITMDMNMFRVGTITGIVQSTSGMPISGAKVSVINNRPDNMPYNETAISIAANWPILECTTDAQGRFKMENVPLNTGNHLIFPTLKVSAEGYVSPLAKLLTKEETLFISLAGKQEQPTPPRPTAPPSTIQRPIQPQPEEPIPQPALEKIPSDFPAIQLHESVLGEVRGDITLRDAVIRVVNAKSDEPMPGVSAKVESKFRGRPVAESLSLVTDEQGLLKFQYPNQITVLEETLLRGEGLPLPQRGTMRNGYAVYDCEVSIEPSQQGGRMLLASRINLGMVFSSDTVFSRIPTIYMQEGHLLVGRVVDTRSGQPLAKSDDGKPIRIAFAGSSWNAEGYPQDGSPVLEVDANGIFQCYQPEGVCWPFILPNGNDQIWPRTKDYEQWQKQGVLIKPGKITTLEFRIAPRLDSDAPAAELPVLEEQAAVAKLLMLQGGPYELDENQRVRKLYLTSSEHLDEHLRLTREFKHLTTLNIELLCINGVVLNDDDIRKILELPPLTTLITFCPPKPDQQFPFNEEPKTIEGRENIEEYFKEEYRALRAWIEGQQRGVIGLPGGGMGGMMPSQGGGMGMPMGMPGMGMGF